MECFNVRVAYYFIHGLPSSWVGFFSQSLRH